MPKYEIYTGKKERKIISSTDCKLTSFSSQISPPPPPPLYKNPEYKYKPIKFALWPYKRPGRINRILHYINCLQLQGLSYTAVREIEKDVSV